MMALADANPENRELFCGRFGVLGYARRADRYRRAAISAASVPSCLKKDGDDCHGAN